MDGYHPRLLAITGATGSLGLHFLSQLLQRDPSVKVLALTRPHSASILRPRFKRLLSRFRNRIQLIDGDLRLLQLSDEGKRALAAADGGIWHFAACTNLSTDDPYAELELYEANELGTGNLLKTLREINFTGPFFHISTAYVAGKRTGPAREDELYVGQTFHNCYEETKLMAEEMVHSFFAEGHHGIVFRPSIVLENSATPGSFKMVDLCAHAISSAIRNREPGFVFRLPETAALNLVHIDWVIDSMIALAGGPLDGAVYHLTGSADTQMEEIASAINDHVPEFPIRFDPSMWRQQLSVASRLFDKVLDEIRPYFTARVAFDRRNTDRALPVSLRKHQLNMSGVVRARLNFPVRIEDRTPAFTR